LSWSLGILLAEWFVRIVMLFVVIRRRRPAATALARKLSHMPILGGNDLEIVSRTSEVIDRLAADIDLAERHVHLLL